jgi:hypothetical protein
VLHASYRVSARQARERGEQDRAAALDARADEIEAALRWPRIVNSVPRPTDPDRRLCAVGWLVLGHGVAAQICRFCAVA